MGQLNIYTDKRFEQDLKKYMKKKGITKKSAAIRTALEESLSRLQQKEKTDFRSWVGLALKAPVNKNPRFKSDDDLWR